MFEKALRFANFSHYGSFKQFDNYKLPYIIHCLSITEHVRDCAKNLHNLEELLCAGVLYDIVKYRNVDISIIKKEFNSNVAQIVKEVISENIKNISNAALLIRMAEELVNKKYNN